MGTEEIIALSAILFVIGIAVFYIIKAKKSGKKCIGCPDASACSGKCASCGCGCGESKKNDEK